MKELAPKWDGPRRAPSKWRCAAIWALGKCYQDQPDPELSAELVRRINDLGPLDAELQEVRYACIVALGWMRDRTTTATIKTYLGPSSDPIETACRWTVSRFDAP
jgi:hypothetical protein